ncbi:beta-ribofuranosylaminobenzene 5'-phosphate synthase [Cupriavidus basilensis]|uniref:Beta-ribofuranosylaminobenzene 5'-phosphate synthase n=1 Tax=Cupriavidus basilensis TaxID=68895 RepID=A0ABT6B013_9BURK|nr:beta-ribofuranosylaminobenzene 5'-phosphate synthase family protein [Cupriavidus basilensis]MDF3838205.1 beta-ribofuranosylaminobenzene 5'-phosphate synthase [Cupriavidus basilensis]
MQTLDKLDKFDKSDRPARDSHGLNPPGTVRVHANGRLHLGFLDPGASLGRRFGSLGLSIGGPSTLLDLGPAAQDRVAAADPAARQEVPRVSAWLERLKQASGIQQPLAVWLHEVLPAHAGFGSGTQLALALGRAFAGLHGLPWSGADIARLLGRGGRSGVGIAAFERGGLLVDSGPRSAGSVAPLTARFDFPPGWRIVLLLDHSRTGLHGTAEKQAMQGLPSFPQALSADLCHRVLMQILPAAAEQDFAPFAAGLNHLQQVIGGYFAPAQGGVYSSPAVSRALDWISRHAHANAAAIGQSSWGPTGFAIVPSQAAAEQAVAGVRAAGLLEPRLQARIVTGANRGAQVAPPARHEASLSKQTVACRATA